MRCKIREENLDATLTIVNAFRLVRRGTWGERLAFDVWRLAGGGSENRNRPYSRRSLKVAARKCSMCDAKSLACAAKRQTPNAERKRFPVACHHSRRDLGT